MAQNMASDFAAVNGIIIDHAMADTATAHVDITDASRNQYGIAHGGLLFSLADSVAGACALADNQSYVTMQANINYLKATRTDRISAHAHLIHRGTSTCVIEVNIYADDNALLANGTFTMFRIMQKKNN